MAKYLITLQARTHPDSEDDYFWEEYECESYHAYDNWLNICISEKMSKTFNLDQFSIITIEDVSDDSAD